MTHKLKGHFTKQSFTVISAQATNESGFIEVHQHFENSALQVASVLPAGADLPDQECFCISFEASECL